MGKILTVLKSLSSIGDDGCFLVSPCRDHFEVTAQPNGNATMKKSPEANPESKRKRGRPKRSKPAVTPEVLEQVGELWATGCGVCEIGRKLGLDHKTVTYHLDQTLKPTWEKELGRKMSEEIFKIDMIEKICWRKFQESENPVRKSTMKKQLVDEGGELQIVEKLISKQNRTAEIGWLGPIQWCIEQRSKLLGYGDKSQSHTDVIPTVVVEVETREEATEYLRWRDIQSQLSN